MNRNALRLLLHLALTLGAFGLIAPAFRDSGASHLQNPHWHPHAKLHMMWFLAGGFFSGLVHLYLIWIRRRNDYGLILSWQLCNLLGFWTAALSAPLYRGAVVDPMYHLQIVGISENLVAFAFFSGVWLLALALYAVWRRGAHGETNSAAAGRDQAHA
jgi:hypothetical protein